MLKLVRRLARAAFTRKVRASLYAAAIAAVAALVGSGELPPWSVAVAGPLLLALLNLSPDDVDPDQDGPER